MVKTAIDLQFQVSERIDTKIRSYFGFATAVYTVAQALVLRNDVHEKLGANTATVRDLAITATGLLVIAMAVTLHALRPVDEEDVHDTKLRELLDRGYHGDEKAGADGVNLMIGQLKRRKATNKKRTNRLNVVIVVVAITVLVAFVQIALAVEAVT